VAKKAPGKKVDPAVVKLLKKQEALVAELTAQLKKQGKKLKRSEADRADLERRVEKHKARAKAAKRKYQAIKDHEIVRPVPNLGPDSPLPDQTAAGPDETAMEPDESWTVTRLRAEARARGVVGYSRLTKAQILQALR